MALAQKSEFSVGDKVVYPTHGVGCITKEEVQAVAGMELNLYVISFAKDKMILHVPKTRALKSGLRHLSTMEELEEALQILQDKPKILKGMWSKRAQEYESKINSGSLVLLSEVLRDLYKAMDENRSYSERVIYELALNRFVYEYAAIKKIDIAVAQQKVIDILDTSHLG